MYHKISIQHLSPAQISKLLNGHKVRVKHGTVHHIHVSEEQHKKIMKAHAKGSAHTIQFDPFQISEHQYLRGGSFKSVMKSVGKVVKAGAKKYGPAIMDYGVQAGKAYLEGAGAEVEGGSFKSVMKKVGKIAKPLAKKYGPAILDYGVQAGKDYLEGAGVKSRRAVRGRALNGSALYPAGYGLEDEEEEEGEGFAHMRSPAQLLQHTHHMVSGMGARAGARGGRRGRSILGDIKKGIKKYAPKVIKGAIKYAPEVAKYGMMAAPLLL